MPIPVSFSSSSVSYYKKPDGSLARYTNDPTISEQARKQSEYAMVNKFGYTPVTEQEYNVAKGTSFTDQAGDTKITAGNEFNTFTPLGTKPQYATGLTKPAILGSQGEVLQKFAPAPTSDVPQPAQAPQTGEQPTASAAQPAQPTIAQPSASKFQPLAPADLLKGTNLKETDLARTNGVNVYKRDLQAEQGAIDDYIKLTGKMPKSNEDWLSFHDFAYEGKTPQSDKENAPTGQTGTKNGVSGKQEGVDYNMVADEMNKAQGILNKYGISAPDQDKSPVAAFSDTYKQIYDSLGLGSVKSSIEQMNKEIQDIDNEMTDKMIEAGYNPWLSEALRSRKIKAIQDKYSGQKEALINRLQLDQSLLESGREEAKFVAQQGLQISHWEQEQDQALMLKAIDWAEKEDEAKRKMTESSSADYKEVQGGLYDIKNQSWVIAPQAGKISSGKSLSGGGGGGGGAGGGAGSGAAVKAASPAAKDWLSQFNSGLMSIEDIYTKIGSSKEAYSLKNEIAGLVAQQGGKRIYGSDDATMQAINSQIKNIDDLLNGDVGSIVGLIQGGFGLFPDKFNIYKQDALAIAKNLVSNQTLQALAEAKSKGITFGALSEKELGVIAESASRIAAKMKEDKDGNITGFSGSEKKFKEDLKTIRNGLKKSIVDKTQSSAFEPDESAALDTAFSGSSPAIYFK